MADRTVARRYAEAFVNLLEKSRHLESGLEDLQSVAQVYSGSKDLQRFLGSPEIGPEEKEKLLGKVWSSGIGEETHSLLHLLLDWDRVDHLLLLAEEATAVAEARQGISHGEVTTAHPISSVEVDRIAQAIGRGLGKKVILERQVNPKLIGGARVTVGTVLLDKSVRRMLDEVRSQLKEVKVN